MLNPPAHDPTNPAFVSAVGRALIEFLGEQSELADRTVAIPLLEAAQVCVAGGKRLRPAFCYWGYVTAAGRPTDPGPLLRAAATGIAGVISDDELSPVFIIPGAFDTRVAESVASAVRRFAES